MRSRLKLFGFLALYWIAFQIVIRIIFLLYNYEHSESLSASDMLLIFVHGFKMDLSLAGYLLLLPGLLLCASVFTTAKWFVATFHTIIVILLLLASVIVIVDMELYRHWGFRLNTTPFMYVGSEAVGSVSIWVTLKLLLSFVALFSAFVYLYWKKISARLKNLGAAPLKTFFVILLLTGSLFIPIRGSFTVAPMNTGFVYFHQTNSFANHAAINVIWNFMNSLRKSANVQYPEDFYDQQKAKQYFEELYEQRDSTTKIFTNQRPNIILVILESFTADVIEPLGGMPGIAPNLNKLCKEGVLFTNFFSSGDRTDKGLISILSGYPAQPATSIIKFPAKTQRLHYLNHYMDSLGYQTSFVYGGDIDFANFRSYLTNCRFDNMTTEDDFSSAQNESKWGVHDHIVLERAFAEADTATNPFFKVILTLSSHEPFDVPMAPHIKGLDEESLFLNSCYYTDKSIGTFVEKAKQREWWDNTVVIFVADHGHRYPGNKDARDKARFRIPLLMIGGAIKKDTTISTYASQTDIANTLLGQLDEPQTEFKFSKNILATEVNSFAAYFFTDGYGFVCDSTYIVYENAPKQFMINSTINDDNLEISKAYQQMLYSDYNRK